jgi:hypothetical protein
MRTHSSAALFAQLLGIVVGIVLAIGSLYVFLFPMLHLKTSCGFVIGIFAAAVLSFVCIRKQKGLIAASVGALIVGAIVSFLSILLTVNAIGE